MERTPVFGLIALSTGLVSLSSCKLPASGFGEKARKLGACRAWGQQSVTAALGHGLV